MSSSFSDSRLDFAKRLQRVCTSFLLGLVLLLSGCGKESPEVVVEEPAHAFTNKLVDEKSPYLLQHAHNPVDWYPWGEEAFEQARLENKPIFLSVGYSTCYWCHVMEKESFEDEEVAAVLNEHFIAVKVDREERPDIDGQYMLATQLATGRGGWPNSVWLTADGKPWMAGTYFSKPDFIKLLLKLSDLWETRRADVDKEAERLSAAVSKSATSPNRIGGTLDVAMVEDGLATLLKDYEPRYGGFGMAPKFPPHDTLALILERYRETGDDSLLLPLTKTLNAMWLGGMHDHVGGGFHRYSTDREWLLPHFEKMLYDNAQLMRSYSDAYLITKDPIYRKIVEDIYLWVSREMTGAHGAFYSAIDAGEVGREGETQVWHREELDDILGAERAVLFSEIYQIVERGNFVEERSGERTGENIPHLTKPIDQIAQDRGVDPIELAAELAQMRAALLANRMNRPQPHVDDKVLTSWNGLMIGALAYAGGLFDEPKYTDASIRAADFILTKMRSDDGVLLRTYRDGIAKLPGYLDDYAYLAQGLVELYKTTGESRWLEEAERLAESLLLSFEDTQNGGFYFTSAEHEQLLLRSKQLGAGGNLPDANGILAQVFLELAEILERPEYVAVVKRSLESLTDVMQRNPSATQQLLVATQRYLKQTAGAESTSVSEADAVASADVAMIEAYQSRLSVKPGETFEVAVTLQIEEGWHLYAQNPEIDFLIPTTVEAISTPNVSFGDVRAPQAEEKFDALLQQTMNTYIGEITFYVPVTISAEEEAGTVEFTLEVMTQACDNRSCLAPQTTALELSIEIDPAAEEALRWPELFEATVESSQ